MGKIVIAEAFPPGEYVADELRERGWTRLRLAKEAGCSVEVIDGLIDEGHLVTSEIANALAKGIGTSPQIWVNLQKAYDDWRATKVDLAPVDGSAPSCH